MTKLDALSQRYLAWSTYLFVAMANFIQKFSNKMCVLDYLESILKPIFRSPTFAANWDLLAWNAPIKKSFNSPSTVHNFDSWTVCVIAISLAVVLLTKTKFSVSIRLFCA